MKVGTGTVAITGGSGFIGRYLVDDLAAAGYTPIVLGRNPAPDNGARQTDYSRESLKAALEGVDAVVHLAGRRMTREDDQNDVTPFLAPNVEAVADLMAACASLGVRKVIYASTIAVYSPASGLPYRETSPTRPINAYALSKLMGESCVEMLGRLHALAAVSLRFAAVYGHGEKGTPALMKFVNQASRREKLVLKGNMDYRIDQIYIRDVTAAILASLRSPCAAGVFNIGGGQALPVLEIAETVNTVFDNAGNLSIEDEVKKEAPRTVMDLEVARATLGWEPRYSLRSGLEDFRSTRDITV
ncbi:NAD-dependent epimerase/dehydratase family protein [Pararhizobium sp. BT-229]|uniref:NAD-dependent epimerase/dehydratase family protein n=1 Tax=Pararhizobium sp. BT-229 TaxID=2986923 RepID=UPI0021F70E3B|nr:NAD-dependent epimerase/dehydratase family protein [Pararhizobium sp. BT-229]MCV9962226.1 NAD-dependent epimerase/dehydratase family protein [Pararhizobium sp. BT-229]